MKVRFAIALIVPAVLLWLAGCEVSDPGSPTPNQPPTTQLTSAPLEGDTVNHLVALHWAGNDPDGEIAGFHVTIDDQPSFFTTVTDTVIALFSPDEGTVTPHTISIQAEDDEALRDPNPATRQFYTTNFAPTLTFADGSVPEGAVVGHGFQLVLSAFDSNDAGTEYAISFDDTISWSEWLPDSVILIADLSLEYTIINGDSVRLFPEGASAVSNEGLTAGTHIIYARTRDAGGALSPVISRTVNIEDGHRPVMDPNITGTYGAEAFYRDGSVYRSNNVTTVISFSASAAAYRGQINAYQYFPDSTGNWSPWIPDATLEFENLATGEYPFQFTARDIAGELADTISFSIRIVEPNPTDSVIVVDETRDGNGNPGSPSDEEVDAFYDAILMSLGVKYRQIDYSDRPGGISYVSPFDLQNAGVVLWHADDRAEKRLGDNTCANCILTQYLDRGGRLILSGWDLMGALVATDSGSFGPGNFSYEKLRTFTAIENTDREATGFTGVNGFPDVQMDAAKLPAAWGGTIDQCWVFTPRGECRIIGLFTVINPDENTLDGRPTAYIYDQSFFVSVFGVPLFFTNQSQAQALFEVLMPQMMIGLAP